MDSNNNWLQQLMMVGLGTTSLVAEKLRQVSDDLVKDGKLNPEQAKAVIDDIAQQLKSEQGNFDVQMQRQMRNMMQDLGVARQSEVDELRGRIDRLERQLRDLENKLWR
ncbi:phasin family protein [Nostoc sp. FACHB-892]|jgi:polyhydroxyalkanoate synthesis regulator phasin|uniref:phasin family protein n=1 Tax=unclassified Nostoc TaxID=2593658 RepID=UPI001686373F|nr:MULTISPECIES: phasin family protein [unclassified Nostoc]MBD0385331.1 phasin family protein [Nostoc sp. C3-bin3]MBW4426067.1 phasin family protein [Nostoc desertorum CM1-VF14]MBW4452157.1 phasin family protein [Nostoc indistinguendum CM1-VF10]MBD2725398.1 phasin family protein [Nostoc sp. FACHB-892]MEA5625697.1 phasin family protein [Nostoc sp. UHCC 0251]